MMSSEKTKMIVYRIQNEHNSGPYNHSSNLYHESARLVESGEMDVNPHDLPSPTSDHAMVLMNNHDGRFAFNSLKDLYRWFQEPIRKHLHEKEYFIAKYEIPVEIDEDLYYDKFQVCFSLSKGTKVGEFSIL